MVEIKNISKKFGEFEALKNVSFEAMNGEIVGLLGENGAGKSTLLRIISTMITATSGEAFIDGEDVHAVGNLNKIGILFGSEVGLYERFTARENIIYFAKLHGMKNDDIVSRIKFLVNKFSMEEYIDKLVSTFSKGMKQKVAIARSIVHDPEVILFDEPDSGLDFSSSKIVLDFLKECESQKKVIIFSSHSLDSIMSVCSRIVILHKGVLVDQIELDSLKNSFSISELRKHIFQLVCPDESLMTESVKKC